MPAGVDNIIRGHYIGSFLGEWVGIACGLWYAHTVLVPALDAIKVSSPQSRLSSLPAEANLPFGGEISEDSADRLVWTYTGDNVPLSIEEPVEAIHEFLTAATYYTAGVIGRDVGRTAGGVLGTATAGVGSATAGIYRFFHSEGEPAPKAESSAATAPQLADSGPPLPAP